MRYSILCIFLQSGHTFTFKDVEITSNNETHLQFDYVAMADGKIKTGTFPKGSIAGWSVTHETVKHLASKEQKP